MSFLSDYGSEPNSVSAIYGIPQDNSGFEPSLTIAGGSGGQTVGAYSSIAFRGATQINTAGFNHDSGAGNAIFYARAFKVVQGIGNALIINTGTATTQFDLRGTNEVRNVGLGAYSGSVTMSLQNSGTSTSLTSWYGFSYYNQAINHSAIIGNCTSLANITVKNIYFGGSYYLDFRITNAALTAQSVENLLVAMNNGTTSNPNSPSINLSGGTSSGASALTAAAAAARTSLIAKGYTVTLNP